MYRTHNCGELRKTDIGQEVQLAGWVSQVRNFGKMVFITLRDHYGVTQIFFPDTTSDALIELASSVKPESIVFVKGTVKSREADINPDMPTGEIELSCHDLVIDSLVKELPFPLNDILPPEDLRLKYRFIDLRRERLQNNIKLRSQIIYELRKYLIEEQDFLEIQTPILTASSPEGARDFVVPSRLYPGKFYALPQAPQQYKQLLMCSGFDKYFQIAPCFRDEAARADRSPGEFYQLDMEMAFPTQESIFAVIEGVLVHLNNVLDTPKEIVQVPFPRIPFREAMEKYGSDKPDLRFGLEINNLSDIFANSEFRAFAANSSGGNSVRGIRAPKIGDKSRRFFDDLEKIAKTAGARGLAYVNFPEAGGIKGSVAKFLSETEIDALRERLGVEAGDSVLIVAGKDSVVLSSLGRVRSELGNSLELFDPNKLNYCWVVDFPMFEYDEEAEKIDFSHNPFSMPQGGMDALLEKDPLDILAYQYDIICNGIELSSGAIRNHRPDIMYKAFEIAGYEKEMVNDKFGHMISAFSYGAPPHGGLAPGIERIVMIYADEKNIREITPFPMNQKALDLMMSSPTTISQEQLDELSLQIIEPVEE